MFETHEEAEIPFPAVFGYPQVRAWSCVWCRLFAPWLHVVCRVNQVEGGESYALHETIFLPHVVQLLQLQQDPHVEIVQIDLMSPGRLNGTGRWKLEPLAEIWEGFVPMDHGNQRAFVYVLADGTRYVDAAFDTLECDLVDRQCVVKVSKAVAARKK